MTLPSFDFFRHQPDAMMVPGLPSPLEEAATWPPSAADWDAPADGPVGGGDYLAQGVQWPIYPQIAAHHADAARPARWRTSVARGSGQHFDLTEMIARSRAILESAPQARSILQDAVGGPKGVARIVEPC